MATDIVIASAARTPVGSFNGAFGAVPAHDLGKAAGRGVRGFRPNRGRTQGHGRTPPAQINHVTPKVERTVSR